MKYYENLSKQRFKFLTLIFVLLFGLSLALSITSSYALGSSPIESIGYSSLESETTTSNEDTGNPQLGEIYQMKGNGETFRLQNGNNWMIRTQFGLQLNFSLQLQAELRIEESTINSVGPLPVGSYSLGYYYHFELNNSNALGYANLSVSYNPADCICDNCLCEECLHFAFYNTSLNQWQYVNSWMNKNQHIVYAATDHFSYWTVLASSPSGTTEPQPGIPYQLQNNGTSIKIQAGHNWMFRTQSGFQFNLSINEPVELSINETDDNPTNPLPANIINMSKFMHIELNSTTTKLNATFCMEYNQTWLGTKDPSRLHFVFYNTSANQWQYTYSWTRAENGKIYVYTNTTHFSTWSAVYVLPTSDSTNLTDPSNTAPISGFEIFVSIITVALIAVGSLIIKKHRID